jgi:hypothetical protein
MQFLQYFLTDGEVLLKSLLEWNIEPLIEIVEGVEDSWHEEV